MKKVLLLMAMLIAVITVKAQVGTRDVLESKNGYKGIVLGSDISTFAPNELSVIDPDKKYDADSCITYELKNDKYLKFSEDINLQAIGIRAFRSKVIGIILILKKSDGYGILNVFTKAFGIPVKYNQFMDNYHWSSINVDLSLNFEHASGSAIYTCSPLQSIIDKKRVAIQNKAVKDL